ncbi:Ubiquitin modifier 1 [Trichostrongylus colubriformis]|uniref:Ubiquitin-related modifier 1 homolog n=1 Tax=Trichostrongylus colubriformis TaxID=6319 RepID=A0AAN8EPJ0_TRICO
MSKVNVNLEFSGGCEFLVGNQKRHEVSIPSDEDFVTVGEVLSYVKDVMLKDCDRRELLIDEGKIRPGVLVLVNDCDWELLGCEQAELHNGDLVTFISTLHGG